MPRSHEPADEPCEKEAANRAGQAGEALERSVVGGDLALGCEVHQHRGGQDVSDRGKAVDFEKERQLGTAGGTVTPVEVVDG